MYNIIFILLLRDLKADSPFLDKSGRKGLEGVGADSYADDFQAAYPDRFSWIRLNYLTTQHQAKKLFN